MKVARAIAALGFVAACSKDSTPDPEPTKPPAPTFDAAAHLGFAVLRGNSATGSFLQVGSLVAGANQFTDTRIRRGATYWYRVVVVGDDGKSSRPSAPVSGLVPR